MMDSMGITQEDLDHLDEQMSNFENGMFEPAGGDPDALCSRS